MAALDTLPPDQRAVLQLVLQRGRGYDDIAQMLSIDRAGVRDRALQAFDALGPHTRVPAERRALITDYMLGQLPDLVAGQTRERLAESPSERAWARVLASELAPLAREPLPEIPVDGTGEEPVPTGAPEQAVEEEEPTIPADYGFKEPAAEAERPTSRRGGALLLGLGAVAIVAAIVIVIAASGGSSKKHPRTTASSTPASTPATTPTTSTNGAQLIAQVNLVSPAGAKKTAGVAQVIRQGTNTGLVIVAQGVPANTSHDAYAVWLFNSASDSRILGFVNPGVKADGKLQTAGVLPPNASHYKQLLVTLETQAKPHGPGKIVLEGSLSL